jgi:predicted RNase H-like nuclease (RuvC/YqgF family)
LNQEKFVNSYIDLLNATISEAINKNIVIQAQKKVLEDELKDIKRKDDLIASLRDSHAKEISDLKQQLNDARKQKEISLNEFNELKKNSQHVETFKNELMKEREKVDNLNIELSEKNVEIEKLKKQISKKSKTHKTNFSFDDTSNFILVDDDESTNTVKDAGKF